jgi:hypothetical protein
MTARHRLTPVERLARDILWAECGKRAGHTKTTFWASQPVSIRAERIIDAHRFVFLCRRLGAPTLAKILAEKETTNG